MPGSGFFNALGSRLTSTLHHSLCTLTTGWREVLPLATISAAFWQVVEWGLGEVGVIYEGLFTVDPYLATGAMTLFLLDTLSGTIRSILDENDRFDSEELGHFTSKVLGYASVVVFFSVLANGAEEAPSAFGQAFGILDDVSLLYVIIREGKSLTENTHDTSFSDISRRISDAFSSLQGVTESSSDDSQQ